MGKKQTIDLPKLPSFDVSNASSSITDQFIYGDKNLIKSKPKQNHTRDKFNIEFSRSDLQNVIHIITAELKNKGSKTPFMFLPFRQENDEYKLKQFLTRIINDSEFIEEKLLISVVKRTDEYTLVSSLKFFWCRLPGNAIIGWKSYNKFVKLEKEKEYPKKAFLTIMPYCLSSAAHASIVYDFLDLLVSVASYTKDNKLSGRKICKMCGIWAFNGPAKKSNKTKTPSFANGLNDWVPASDALFHIMLAFLRSILPDDEKNQKLLPKTLQSLISSNSYPPPLTKHSDPSNLLEVPIITMNVNNPSKNPLELILKIGKTLTFDNAKLFYSRDDYILLKSLFKDSHQLINRLSSENRKIVDRICNLDQEDLTVDEALIKFKLVPGWSDDLVTFDNQEKVPFSQEYYTANVSKTLIDDYFIWTWLSTIGSEETNMKRKIFGKAFILEVELTESYKKWVIIEEQDINGKLFHDDDSDSDMELELKLQKLRKQEQELLERKLKKNSKQDLPPIPITKEVPPIPTTPKSKKLKKLDESSKKISGKLASSIRKFSNGEHRRQEQIPESKPLPVIKDAVQQQQLPRDRSEHNFKLPEFDDDDEDDLANDFEKYLQKSTYSETKPLNVKSRTPSPHRSSPVRNSKNIEELTQMVDNVALEQQQQYEQYPPPQSHRQQMVSVYGLEQLQQYSPYINYEDGQFPSLSPQRSSFHEFENEKRYSRSPEIEQQQYSPQHSPQRESYNQSLQPDVDPTIPSNQTSGSSSRLKRKPPPPVEANKQLAPLERPHSQYSGNPITPSNSQQQLRPISQYSGTSYANSFAPPTPQHQLLGFQSPQQSTHSDQYSDQYQPQQQQQQQQQEYQYRSMIPLDPSMQHIPSPQQQQQHSPERQQPTHLPLPVNYQYKSMLSPVEKTFNDTQDKSLPPSPVKSFLQTEASYRTSNEGQPQLSAYVSPEKSLPPSPTRSLNEQLTVYSSAHNSPSKMVGSPSRSHISQTELLALEEMNKPLPPSPAKSFASAQFVSPSKNSLYGDSDSPTKASLYGNSKQDLLAENPNRDSTYHSLANDDEAAVKDLHISPAQGKPSRASAIIENFDMLENELQDFLNGDSKSVDSHESFKTGVDEQEAAYLTPPISGENQVGNPVQPISLSPESQEQRAIQQPQQHQQPVAMQYPHKVPPPAQNYPPQQQQQSPSPQRSPQSHPQFRPQNTSQEKMVNPQFYPADPSKMYAPNGSNPSISSQGSSYGSDGSYGRQLQYPPYQQLPPPQQQQMYPRKLHHHHHHSNRAPGSREKLQVPNGYPVQQQQQQQQQQEYPVQQRANAHSPARPSNLGPNYQQAPPHSQQRVSPQFYPQQKVPMPPQGMPPQGMPPQGMPPQGMPPQGMPPQGMPPQGMPQGMPPQGRGRSPYKGGPYGPGSGPQFYPGTPPKQQYYQQSYLPPHPDQHGSRTPHHPSSGSFSPVPNHSPRSFNGNPMSPPQFQQTRSDYAIQQMPPSQKMNKLHGHTDDRNTKKNLRDAIATGGFGI